MSVDTDISRDTIGQVRPAPVTTIDRFAEWLAAHSITVLRISLGLVLVGFAVPKLFPGMSPAEPLVTKAVHALSFGLIDGQAAMVLTALVEISVGLTLLTGRFLRAGLVAFGLTVLGFLSPLVLFPGELFTAGGPTLAAQYIIKDVILFAAGLVVAARMLGARLERS